MSNVAVSRDYLSRIFDTLSRDDAAWALKTLSDRLFTGRESESEKPEPACGAVWKKPLPQAVLNMTVRHRKNVSYETAEEYKADLAETLVERYK